MILIALDYAATAQSDTVCVGLDRAPSARRFDAQGFLHVEQTAISKAQIRHYKGDEIPGWQALGLDAKRVYGMLCLPEELEKAAGTFNNLPLLRDHLPINADSIPGDMIVGSTGSDCAFDGTYLRTSLVVWKRPSIDGVVQNRKRELSCGYAYKPDMTPGNYEGLQYDGIMRDIVGNHVALVIEGRAGPDVMVGDEIMKLTSRSALMVSGALAGLVRPLLAADAKVDISDALDGVNATSRADAKLGMDGKVADKVVAMVTPFLATDKALTVDDVKAALALVPVIAADDAIGDAPPAVVPPVVVPPVVTTGMDAAAVQALVDKAKTDTAAEQAAIRTAEREVRPFVGEIAAMDSAAAVYRFALDALKVDTKALPDEALGPLLRAMPKPVDAARETITADSRTSAAAYLDAVVGKDRQQLHAL